MPIASPPSRGFAEFQRTSPYDSGVLYSDSLLAIGGGIASAIYDVSRFAYLGGTDTVAAGACTMAALWTADPAGAVTLGIRNLVLSSLIGDAAQYRLPNLGPFVQLFWTAVSAGAPTHSSQIFSTNRAHPCELIPKNPVLVDQDAAAITSSATATVYPSDYYSGPMMVWSTISSGGTVFFQYLTSANTWNTIQQWPVAALTNVQTTVVAPPGAWRFQVLNGAASAQTYNLKVTPSLTGGS